MRQTPALNTHLVAYLPSIGITFIRLFGSAVRNPATARDVDLLVGPQILSWKELAQLSGDLEGHFGQAVDVIQFTLGINPYLVQDIAEHSRCLWEEPEIGRRDYAILLDRFLAVSGDEILAFPNKLRYENHERVIKVIKKLYVS